RWVSMMLVGAIAAAGCSGGSQGKDYARPWGEMYCELLDPHTVQPVLDVYDVAVDDVDDRGGPHGEPGLRNFECLLDSGSVVLASVTIAEGLSDDYVAARRTSIKKAMATYADNDEAYLSTVDDGTAYGYVRYVPGSADRSAPSRVAGG